MGKDSLPLVFGPGKLQYATVSTWYEGLLSQKEAYVNCYIPSFTRVKNLGSQYMHEYCQFIVEDRSTGERARVYAERMNEKNVDVVTVGRDEKAPRGWDELPLPLTSIVFADKAQQPTLLDVAKVLNSVSVVGAKYTFYDKNCFWFAYTAFDTARLSFQGTLRNWLWVNPGGKGGGSFGDAWGIGFPTLFKYLFKPTADAFKVLRPDSWDYYRPGDEGKIVVTVEDYVKNWTKEFIDSPYSAVYCEWYKGLGIDITKEDLTQITSQLQSRLIDLDKKGELTWSQDFDGAVADLTNKIMADPDVSKYLAKYNSQPISSYTPIDIDIIVNGPLGYADGGKVKDAAPAKSQTTTSNVAGYALPVDFGVSYSLIPEGLQVKPTNLTQSYAPDEEGKVTSSGGTAPVPTKSLKTPSYVDIDINGGINVGYVDVDIDVDVGGVNIGYVDIDINGGINVGYADQIENTAKQPTKDKISSPEEYEQLIKSLKALVGAALWDSGYGK